MHDRALGRERRRGQPLLEQIGGLAAPAAVAVLGQGPGGQPLDGLVRVVEGSVEDRQRVPNLQVSEPPDQADVDRLTAVELGRELGLDLVGDRLVLQPGERDHGLVPDRRCAFANPLDQRGDAVDVHDFVLLVTADRPRGPGLDLGVTVEQRFFENWEYFRADTLR